MTKAQRRIVAAVVAVVVAAVFGVAPAAGATELSVSGSFTATGNFSSTPDCMTFRTWHDGGGDWTGLGTTTFHLDYCVELDALSEWSPLAGTFTIAAGDGSLTGDAVGRVSNARGPDGFPAEYELTITGGTGDYRQASGSLTIDAVWNGNVIPVLAMEGTVAGTVVIPPPTPASRGDCMGDGWRDLGDDDGTPFRNQGECIAWVSTR